MSDKGNFLGEFEELVLLSVASLAGDVYGVSILNDINEQTGRDANISAIHEVLKRLERKGYVRSKMGGATEERGGRRKRLFALTASGRHVLHDVMKMKIQLYKRLPGFSLKSI